MGEQRYQNVTDVKIIHSAYTYLEDYVISQYFCFWFTAQ